MDYSMLLGIYNVDLAAKQKVSTLLLIWSVPDRT